MFEITKKIMHAFHKKEEIRNITNKQTNQWQQKKKTIVHVDKKHHCYKSHLMFTKFGVC